MIAYLTVGISASGKTTWAEKMVASDPDNWVNINRDSIRFQIIGVEDWSKWKFTKENENTVTERQLDMMQQAASDGKNVIISDTNINQKTVRHLTNTLKSLGYTVSLVWFDIELREAILRDSQRTNPVKPRIINDQYERYVTVCQEYEASGLSRILVEDLKLTPQ